MILTLFFLVLIISLTTVVQAEDVADKENLMRLLEFIGDWETSDGEWIDPESTVLQESNEQKADDYRQPDGGMQ